MNALSIDDPPIRRARASIGAIVSLPLAIACLALTGCCGGDVFTESLVVRVVDTSGQPVTDAQVYFSVDGGPEQAARCFSSDDRGTSASTTSASTGGLAVAGCLEWETELEVKGAFAVRATSADGARSGHGAIDIGKGLGACHVDGKTMTITLR